MANLNKFKNAMGYRYLRGLFFEESDDPLSPMYTLKDYDHTVSGKTYLSLYRLYMKANDPTEYTFATAYLDGWQHWTELSQCTWFQPYIQAWRLELETKLKSQALAKIMAASKGDTRDAFQASKYLVEKGWSKNTKGRPNKEAIKEAAHRIASEEKQINEDALRLSIN